MPRARRPVARSASGKSSTSWSFRSGATRWFVELDGKQEGFIESKDLTNKVGELTVKVGSR